MSWYYADDLTTVVGTGSSYVLSASDVGEQMYFEVSFTDNDGFLESAQYSGTHVVQSIPVTVTNNNLYVYNSDSSDSYYLSDGSTSDGYFNFSNLDNLLLSGQLELSDGSYVDASSSDVTVGWYVIYDESVSV